MVGTMKYKIKQGMIFGILFLILAGAMLILAEAFKNAITAERMAAARTVEAGFNRSLDETFGNLNHAVKLSYAIDFEDTGSLTLFHKKVQELMEENEHISYVAYFKEDTLDYIYPADKFRSLIGKTWLTLHTASLWQKSLKRLLWKVPQICSTKTAMYSFLCSRSITAHILLGKL